MAKTYAQFLSQIETLRARADAVRRKEAASQIKRVRDLIALYGLTADDLGLSAGTAHADMPRNSPAKRRSGSAARSTGGAPKYSDGAGHSWSGRGPRPGWLKTALSEGRTLDEFASAGASPGEAAASSAPAKPSNGRSARSKASQKASAPTVKFRLGDKGWSGRGPQPRWLKEAIGSGKSLDELRV